MRPTTPAARLRRLGFRDAPRAERLLAEPGLAPLRRADADADQDLATRLARVADPDLALLALLRLSEAAAATGEGEALLALLADGPGPTAPGERLLAVLGASSALGDMLVARPADLALLRDPLALPLDAPVERTNALRAVGADPGADGPMAARTGPAGSDALRRWYRRRLLQVAATDLTDPEPQRLLPAVAASLADLATAALEAALAVARAEAADEDPDAGAVPLAVIAMGKTGGQELNYVSDVDVIHVTRDDADVAAASGLAARLAQLVGAAMGSEPALWPLDAGLRPEGADGPLVRTLSSHLAYYRRWAQTWERQALLKARPAAGDSELGAEFCEGVAPLVWSAVERDGAVEEIRAMRARVERHVPARHAATELKLGAGGLRDVEFTVQLLQLVHGRTQPELRSPTSLDALRELAAAGLVGRAAADELAGCYRFLRLVEHRIQLGRLRRSHLLPTAEPELRRVARAVGIEGREPAAELRRRVAESRRAVRADHERIFYHPLLPLTAGLSGDEVRLRPEAVEARLVALGYRDPRSAVAHMSALVAGVSRTAMIQRRLLPVMLGLLADGPDPDAGLLAFRRLSDALGATHWYLALLRDSGVATPRLARLLATSRYAADGLERLPQAVAWLGEEALLAVPRREELRAESLALVARRAELAEVARALRYLRRRELLRAAIGDVLDGVAQRRAAAAATISAEVALDVLLPRVVAEQVTRAGHGSAPARLAVLALGRLGGEETGYGSDADVIVVHDPEPWATEADAQRFAVAVATRLRTLLADPGAEPPLEVDVELRPEGSQGPIARTLASSIEYYRTLAQPWERQALLRARGVAGSRQVAARLLHAVAERRYPPEGLTVEELRTLRRTKARVEAERLPRGADPTRHLKLGPGGLADVEWSVQLLQLRWAGSHAELRSTGTLAALAAAESCGHLSAAEARALREAWLLASRIRDAIALHTGRTGAPRIDVLPADGPELRGVAAVMGHGPGRSYDLVEQWLRVSRRARTVVEQVFYGEAPYRSGGVTHGCVPTHGPRRGHG